MGHAHPAPRRPADRSRFAHVPAVVALIATVLVTGCGVRLETPAPPLPVADGIETVRQRAAQDATELADLAHEAATTAVEPVAGILVTIAADSAEHITALAGVYEPFPGTTSQATTSDPTPTTAPDATSGQTPAPSPSAPADATAVLTLLAEAAATARTDASTVPDGPMARLLASIATNRLLLAEALALAVGAPAPAPAPAEPAVPEALPTGMLVQEAVTLVQSEDAAGTAWEVAAARLADDARERAADRATLHRERAQAFADAGGFAGAGNDPRRSTYDLPDALTVAGAPAEGMQTAMGEIEAALAASYATLVATAAQGEREALIDLLADSTRAQVATNPSVPIFPGMPDLAPDGA